MLNSSAWPIDRTQLIATTPGLSGSVGDDNKGVLRIPQISSITRTSPSDSLVLYLEYMLRRSYSSAEKQSVNSTTSADKAEFYSKYELWSKSVETEAISTKT